MRYQNGKYEKDSGQSWVEMSLLLMILGVSILGIVFKTLIECTWFGMLFC